jgi:hypothetical protein
MSSIPLENAGLEISCTATRADLGGESGFTGAY